jgi:DNA-binding beta-propeller fold protein YncE
MSKVSKVLVGAAVASGLAIGPCLAAAPTFKLVTKIQLPTKPGHGDWVAYDPGTHDIYVSLKDHGMAVVSTKTNKVIHAFQNIQAPNTMTFDHTYIYETAAEGAGAGKVNQIVVIDKHDWKIVGRVATKGTSPDATFIDPANHNLYVVSDDNNWIEKYTLGAHPKFLAKYPLEPAKPVSGPDVALLANGTIYATDDSDLETVNPNDGKVGIVADYHLKQNKFGGTKGAFWDPDHQAIWVGTTNHEILVVNPKTLLIEKPIQEMAGADEVAADPDLGLAYAFQGGIPGFDVYSIKDEKYLTTVKTGSAKPTHSGTVDPVNHEVYAYVGGAGALWVYKPEMMMSSK